MVVDYCVGPFTTATPWEPSECYGCPTCQDPLPVAEPAEVLTIRAGLVWWTLTDSEPDLD